LRVIRCERALDGCLHAPAAAPALLQHARGASLRDGKMRSLPWQGGAQRTATGVLSWLQDSDGSACSPVFVLIVYPLLEPI
jgi:hypothetical protein